MAFEAVKNRALGHVHKRVKTLGFTLVELLVVIAIIGILIALLLPAGTIVAMFLCPSDPEQPLHDTTLPSGAVIPMAGSNYAMNQGSGMDEVFHPSFAAADGLCWVGVNIRFPT